MSKKGKTVGHLAVVQGGRVRLARVTRRKLHWIDHAKVAGRKLPKVARALLGHVKKSAT